MKRIRHFHLHDNWGGQSQDDDLHLPIGDGTLDFRAIVASLMSTGYDGTITLEVKLEFQVNCRVTVEELVRKNQKNPGLTDIVVFPNIQDRFARIILTSEVLTLEGRLQRKGPTGLAISVIMDKALVGLCGPLTKLLGYVMKIPKIKTYSKPLTAIRVIPESDVSEYPTQLALGF